MTPRQPFFQDAAQSRLPWLGAAALMLVGVLIPSTGGVMVPFGLALTMAACFQRFSSSGCHDARPLLHDLAMIALFGSAAAAAAALWPVVGRDPAAIGPLLSDLYHKAPELWGSARVKSPPEIFNTIQGCVQPDRISQFPISPTRGLQHQGQTGTLASALEVLMKSISAGRSIFAFAPRRATRLSRWFANALAASVQALGRSPPRLNCFALRPLPLA